MAFPMWWLLIFLAASLALCFVWNWWRSLALKSSVWTMMPILSLTVTCENPPCPSLRTFRPSFSPLRCLPEPCSSLECCNNYTETVSPFTFWLLSFANSQFLVITKSVPLAGRLKAEFSSGEGGRTVMIGWASQQGKSVCPDRLLSREPPCFHGTVTYLTIISLSPPYFPGGATPASSPDSHLGPLCLLFSSKKLFLPLTENPSLVLPSFPVCPGSSVFLPALSSCTSALGLICIFWTLLHLLLFFHGQLLEFTYSFESESESEVTQSCLTLGDPVDCSPPGSSVHGILQARVLEWAVSSFSRGSSRPRDRTHVSRIACRRFNLWAMREAPPTPISKEISLSLNQWFPIGRELFFQEMFGSEWRRVCVTNCDMGRYCPLETRDPIQHSTMSRVDTPGKELPSPKHH